MIDSHSMKISCHFAKKIISLEYNWDRIRDIIQITHTHTHTLVRIRYVTRAVSSFTLITEHTSTVECVINMLNLFYNRKNIYIYNFDIEI